MSNECKFDSAGSKKLLRQSVREERERGRRTNKAGKRWMQMMQIVASAQNSNEARTRPMVINLNL
jgi:hypothetical protein